jgi:hypothetical protein
VRVTSESGSRLAPPGDIFIRIQDSNHRDLVPGFARPLSAIDLRGVTTAADLDLAGVYYVIVTDRFQAQEIRDASIGSLVRVEANFVPIR